MHADMRREFGVKPPVALRAVNPERVADAVVKAITEDGQMLKTGRPMRPLLAIQELALRFSERLIIATGAPRFFRTLAERAGRGLMVGEIESAEDHPAGYVPERG